MSIEATQQPLSKIFSPINYQFIIPTYQRPYAWTEDQARELINDITSAFPYHDSKPLDYFLGSIVVIQEPNKAPAEVVDGQQRLTSLTLLLSVIRYLLPLDDIRRSKITQLLQNEDFDGNLTKNLTIREQDEKFFSEKIRNDHGLETLISLDAGITTDSQRLLKNNSQVFIEELKGSCPEKLTLDEWVWHIAKSILENCYLVVVSTADFDTAYRIFSTLNTRGLDLETCDILKAEILGAILDEQAREKYRLIWEQEESDLGRSDFDTLFTHIHRVLVRERARQNLITEYRTREQLQPKASPQKFIDQYLKPYSDAYEIINKCKFECDNKSIQDKINQLFSWLGRIDNSDWIPSALHFLVRNPYYSNQVMDFYTELERLAAGLMILRKNINEREKIYRRVLNAIDQTVDTAIEVTHNELSDTDRKNIIEILNGDIYPLYKIRSYVLLRLDSELAEKKPSPSFNANLLTIEHVLPQNPVESWLDDWNNQEDREKWVHRLGNLVLLSRRKNSKAQNFDFATKKNVYFNQGDSTTFPLTTTVLNSNQWTPEIVQINQQSYLQKLVDLWSLEDTLD